jgi:CPA2 family monovalent cation:H+ antiporter-2
VADIAYHSPGSAMTELKILEHLLILLACALPLALALRRIGQSTVLGYLATGLVIGPAGFGLIPAGSIGSLAEIGVGLLLFTVGIELPLARLGRMRRVALGGGALQVGLTVAAAALAVWAATGRAHEAAYLGAAAALSSSAIVLKTLADLGDLDAPYTAPATGVSIVQDLATVPMMVVLPALGAGGSLADVAAPALAALGKAVALLFVLWIGAIHLVDRFLFIVARARSPEIFLLAIMTLLLGAALGSQVVGLSLALGAFVAGILLADSDYASQILAEVTPFKGIFQAIFFASVGMLLDLRIVVAQPAAVAAIAAALIVGKAILCALALLAVGVPARVAAAVGIVLAQVGEFSFVLLTLGRTSGVLSEEAYQLALAASFVSMAVAPPLIGQVRRIVDELARLPLLGQPLVARAGEELTRAAAPLSGHIVIAGFGPVGRDVATFLLDHGVEFVVIELNPTTVKDFSSKGIPIFFGDFSNALVLEEAGIERARAFIVTAPDVAAVYSAVRVARALKPDLPIVARTKYRALAADILNAGATEVVEEEFETALEIVARLGKSLELERRVVADHMASQRLERYGEKEERATD